MRKQKNGADMPPESGSAPAPPSSKGPVRARELNAQALLHELRVHQFELEIQNEELRRTRNEIEIALRLYTEIFDFSPIGYATIQGEQIIVNVNLAAGEMLGRPRSVLNGMSFERLVVYEHRAGFAHLLRAAWASCEKQTCLLNLLRGNDEELTVRLSAIPLLRTQPTLLLTIEVTAQQIDLSRHEP
jgi:PAS domain S-box-containing protein